MLGGQKIASDTDVQSVVFSGMDSSLHHILHWAFRNLLTDRTNVWANSGNMLNKKF